MEWKRRAAIIGIFAGVYIGYRYFLPVILPFLVAWILAVWIYPKAVKLEKYTKIKRTIGGSLLLALFLLGVGGLFSLGIMEGIQQIKTALTHIPVFLEQAERLLEQFCKFLEGTLGIQASHSRDFVLDQMEGLREQIMLRWGMDGMTAVWRFAKNALFFLSSVVVVFISTVLIMGDMEQLRKKIWDYSWLVGTRRVVRRLKRTMVMYLKAQVIIIAAVSAVCATGFWLMKSPYFLILGVGIGVMDAIPLIGTGVFLYPAAVVFLIQGKVGLALGCILLDLITSFLREFLEPRLLGDKLGISPIMVLASVYIGIFLYGIWGVFLGPLSFSTIYEIGKQWDIWD